MLLVLTPRSPRADYAWDLLGRLFRVPFRLTDDPEAFRAHDGPRLAYGDAPPDDEAFFIRAAGLLARSGIEPVEIRPFRWEDTLAAFPTDDPRSDLPFDLPTTTFFHASRYEEYLDPTRDAHGRFLPERSVLHREGMLRRPVVDELAGRLRDRLAVRFPRFAWPEPTWSARSTVDVDVAYAYRGRGLMRGVGAAGRQLLRGNLRGLGERVRVLAGHAPDPYDTYAWLHRVHAEHGVPLRYFVLVGAGGPRDRNLPPDGPEMTALVRELVRHAEVGLHPSYASHASAEALAAERDALARLTGSPVRHSRQHFLKLDLPETYRRLAALGITDDHSMGYAPEPGFRAGLATPFPWYDLPAERPLPLTVHPVTYMDGTLNVYQRRTPDEAIHVIDELAASVRAVGGTFSSIWHNDTVRDGEVWAGWRRVFLHTLRILAQPSDSGRNGKI